MYHNVLASTLIKAVVLDYIVPLFYDFSIILVNAPYDT